MGKLSLLPKIIVTAMQVTLVALILLAVVPLAMGGLNVDGYDDSEINYDPSTHKVTVHLEAEITTDLYFDITGFYCDAVITAGGESVLIHSVEMDIPKNGTTPFKFDAEIPVTTFVMMTLLAAENDTDIVVTVNIRGSTLSGMITASVSVDTVITEDLGAVITVADDHIHAEFTVPDSEMLDDILKELPSGSVTIDIGGTICTVTYDPVTGKVVIDVTSSAPGTTSIIDDIEGARNSDGSVDVSYDGGPPVTLTEEEADQLIEML
ncbi:MAG: hypothetical protein FWH44_06140, partial [Methanomassiliicoccaceae archaeon]|nr:hypothetical protein [Methanomassiliicoccaceae archaeon]